jgi:primosomal protein N' (replication factor Y)
VSGSDKHATESYARSVAAASPHDETLRVLGPVEAPLALVRGRYRFRILVKAPRNYDLSAYLREWMEKAPKKKGNLKLEVDVDPQSFL